MVTEGRRGRTPRASWGLRRGEELVPGRLVEASLGGGDRTEAYLVRAALDQRSVVKVLRPDRTDDPGARRRLAREARLLGHFQHPGVTRVLRLDLDAPRPFLEIEHVPGPRLSTDVRHHGPLVARDVARLGRSLADILAHVHDRGVVHLDVKPGNVVLGRVPHLIDFSVAHDLEHASRIDGFVGTDAWASPEQADPARWSTIGPRSDVWGLGATLYFVATGRRPFPDGDRHAPGAARFRQLVVAAPPLPAETPSELATLVAAMLSGDPRQRPSAAVVAERLATLVT